jgi:copper transport protein
VKRALLASAIALAVLLAGAAPAAAHANLEGTEPSSGAQLDSPPDQVVLRFNEPVEASLGAIRVYDSDADRVDDGSVHKPDGDTVALDLGDDLSDGSYVVTWRVTSADAHPIHGAFTFQVGDVATGDSQALARELLAADGGSQSVGGLFAAIRFLAFVSLVVLVGGVAFLVLIWPRGAAVVGVRRFLWWALGTALVVSLLGIGFQGAYAGALRVTDAFDPSVVSSVLDTRFGRVWLARAVLLVVLALLMRPILRIADGDDITPPPTWVTASAAVIAVALLLTPGLSGHASAGDLVPLALVADVVHVVAAAAWFGGLVMLTLWVLPRGLPAEMASVVPRFSRLAFWSVIALVVSGSFQLWRQVGSLDALTSTTFGRLLCLKLALFAGMVGLGALGRVWVRRRFTMPATERVALSGGPGAMAHDLEDEEAARAFRFSVAAEVVIGLVILVVTALLVNAQPAESALATPYATEIVTDDALIDVTIDPAKAGSTEVHVYTLSPDGGPLDVEGMTMTLTLPDEDIGPIEVPLEDAGTGHFSAYDFDLPIAGEWELEVRALIDEFTEASGTDTVRVR